MEAERLSYCSSGRSTFASTAVLSVVADAVHVGDDDWLNVFVCDPAADVSFACPPQARFRFVLSPLGQLRVFLFSCERTAAAQRNWGPKLLQKSTISVQKKPYTYPGLRAFCTYPCLRFSYGYPRLQKPYTYPSRFRSPGGPGIPKAPGFAFYPYYRPWSQNHTLIRPFKNHTPILAFFSRGKTSRLS